MKVGSKLFRRPPSNSGMWPKRVVKALNIRKDSVLGLRPDIQAGAMHHLAFEAAKEILCQTPAGLASSATQLHFFAHAKTPAIVIGVTFSGHALDRVEAVQLLTIGRGGILNAAIGVEDEAPARLVSPAGHAQGL